MKHEVTFEDVTDAATFAEALPVLRQLRDHASDAILERRWRAAKAQGYRLVAARSGRVIVGLVGFRILEDLSLGRTMYIDDLVIDAAARSTGLGAMVLAQAARAAAAEKCAGVRLSSSFAREAAHRFYEREGFERVGYVFRAPVGGEA